MEDEEQTARRMSQIKLEASANGAPPDTDRSTSIPTSDRRDMGSQSPATSLDGMKSRSDSGETPHSVRPTLSRKASRKPVARDAPLYADLPNMTSESCESFQVIPDCLYGSKHMGSTDNDSFDCDCSPEWQNGENHACGEDSDCINRATKMECSATTGNCSGGCQNQRFQTKQYANVSVIKTEKKGYGLRTDTNLGSNDFIYEYIGEVINEPTFRRRMLQYDQQGIKHFYFMSLSKSEFVDATKKGNLGRFCNHSCVPNCYVDKWVVGDKLRMGIFALRNILAGEELVFNYNVDRYGAEPQPCYCGEPNCVGFIGGKTQTERSTKLPAATVEALGIDEADGWDTTVAKKPRKKRAEEDDEEYVNSVQARQLTDEDARKVMATLMQCKEKWIAVKLLERIQRCDDERVIHVVMRMHAYQILKTTLNTFIEDHNVVLQVLGVLDRFPRLTRNKIQDSKIEATIEPLTKSDEEAVASKSRQLLDDWSKLEVAYRIRRRKADPNAPAVKEDRRAGLRDDDATTDSKPSSPQIIDAPKGPRSSAPQRSQTFFQPKRRPPFNGPLPNGWFQAKDDSGNTYFFDKQGTTTWTRPTQPAAELKKGPSKAAQERLAIQSIIDRVTKEGTPKQATQATTPDSKQEKWRSLPMDKQMKIYENTVFPPVRHVLDKFRHKLPKEELKRLGKEIAKKLVSSDYKNNRVADPTARLTEKQTSKIKKYVKDFLDRAVQKYDEHEKRKAVKSDSKPAEDELISDDESRKRKRDSHEPESDGTTPIDRPDVKRVKDDGSEASPPPPPPPPPESTMGELSEEQRALEEQEQALVRENEEAERLEEEANHTKVMEAATSRMQSGMINSNQHSVDSTDPVEKPPAQAHQVLSH